LEFEGFYRRNQGYRSPEPMIFRDNSAPPTSRKQVDDIKKIMTPRPEIIKIIKKQRKDLK